MDNSNGRKLECRDNHRALWDHSGAAQLLLRAQALLSEHPLLQGHIGGLLLEEQNGTLRLSGRLPTFHLKQVLQTTLRDLPGVSAVENRVEVVPPQDLAQVKSRSWEFM